MSIRRYAHPCLLALACTAGALTASTGPAHAADAPPTPAAALRADTYPKATYPGLQRKRYSFGPIKLKPGQNLIELGGIGAQGRPTVPGYITAFRPNLTYLDGTVPGVDVLHLHHGVWLVDGERRWATGEEKTNADMPQGFGWRYDPDQKWVMNHMIHNLYPNKAVVSITWDIDFVPDTSPAAATIKPVTTKWMDVSGPSAYPVFDAKRKKGRKTYTFPDQARPDDPGLGPEREWRVEKDQTLVWSSGHLHPGGMHTELTVTRGGRTVPLFRSVAKYWEPAGPVSWDLAMTATHPKWKVEVKKGDVVKVSGTYDVSRASWYESMAIMFLETYAGTGVGGVDPFVTPPSLPGRVTHGHLAENDNHGGGRTGLPDARAMLSGRAVGGSIAVADFLSARGDLNRLGKSLPTIKRGGTLTFVNKDATDSNIMHSITSCKAPCNRSTGIAYPLADGPVDFDSGNLGFGPRGLTAAKNTDRWTVPKNLPIGTYTYFCRIHPFMRGGFRVVR